MSTTIEDIQHLNNQMTRLVQSMHQMHLAHKPGKSEPKYYSMRDSARLIGRTYHGIRRAERLGDINNPVPEGEKRSHGYTLAEINAARDFFGTRMKRAPTDPMFILPFSSFKGGSGKTTSAIHFAQYAAEAGLRILLIDVDPQATTTSMFGLMPDDDIGSDETIQGYMEGSMESLRSVIRETNWDGLHLIPSNLDVFASEYMFANKPTPEMLRKLREGIEELSDDYDIVVIDPPPSLGMLSLSVMHAANALIIPMPAAIPDVFSTKAYTTMLVETVDSLQKYGYPVDYHFVRLLVTRLDDGSKTQSSLVAILPDLLGAGVLRNSVRKTAALDFATSRGRTLYEVSAPDVTRTVLNRGVRYFNRANEEILTLIRQCWPSHQDTLRDEGK